MVFGLGKKDKKKKEEKKAAAAAATGGNTLVTGTNKSNHAAASAVKAPTDRDKVNAARARSQSVKTPAATNTNSPKSPLRKSASAAVPSTGAASAGAGAASPTRTRPPAPKSSGISPSTPAPIPATSSSNRASSPLKSAMKPSKYGSGAGGSARDVLSSPTRATPASPTTPTSRQSFKGPIDCDDIEGSISRFEEHNLPPLPTMLETIPSTDSADTNNKPPPTSSIKAAAKRTEALLSQLDKDKPNPATTPPRPPAKPAPVEEMTPPRPAPKKSAMHASTSTLHASTTTMIASNTPAKAAVPIITPDTVGDRATPTTAIQTIPGKPPKKTNSGESHGKRRKVPIVDRPPASIQRMSGISGTGSMAGYSKDDMSIISFDKSFISFDRQSRDDMSVISRVSAHMDHFLAEMAMADNAQLEQLAVEEMKHRKIIPQKLKKLNAKISVLNEEKQVLVGLIDQLTELVNNQAENKRKRRERKREKKRLKKERKKKLKRQDRRRRKKEEEERMKKQQELLAESPEMPAKSDDDTDSDEEYLKNQSNEKKKGGKWWASDDQSVAQSVAKISAAAAMAMLNDSDPEMAGDEFAALWDDSVHGSDTGGGLDASFLDNNDDDHQKDNNDDNKNDKDITEPTESGIVQAAASVAQEGSDATKNTGWSMAAAMGAVAAGTSALVAGVTSAVNKEDEKKKFHESFTLTETLPDKPDDDNDAVEKASAKPDKNESDDDLPSVPVNQNRVQMEDNSDTELYLDDDKPLSTAVPQSDRTMGTAPSQDEEAAAQSGISPNSSRPKNRFSMFHETDTYLPDHMPGSDAESDSGSDSDSHSDSDTASLASNTPVVLDDEEDAVEPSASHHLANQLLSRLQKKESKHQEQDEVHNLLIATMERRASASSRNIETFKSARNIETYDQLEHSFDNHQPATRRRSLPTGTIEVEVAMTGTDNNMQGGFDMKDKAYVDAVDEVVNLRQQLHLTMRELEELKHERTFHEAKVKELLYALDKRFDGDEDEDDDIVNSSMETEDNEDHRFADADELDLSKKRKRVIKGLLTQKVDECAELTATVEQLKEEVSQKQAKIDELQQQKANDDVVTSLKSIGSSNGFKGGIEAEEEDAIPGPPELESHVSANVSQFTIEKQLLEKSAECIDLLERIKMLQEEVKEKEDKYQEVHRDLFTANLALGVEVDRKATAQQALEEKTEEIEAIQKENEDLKTNMEKMEEKMGAMDEEMWSKATTIDELKQRGDKASKVVVAQLTKKEQELAEANMELTYLQKKAHELETAYGDLEAQGAANETMVSEFKALLVSEHKLKDELEAKVASVENEKSELLGKLNALRRENEINKAMLEDKQEEGKGKANLHAEVEKLIAENAELTKKLKVLQESEAAMQSERERLVANATNMSIMLADSRAKTDFLQMQLDEHKTPNMGLSSSDHGLSSKLMGSHSEHGGEKKGLRGFMSNAGAGLMGDGSERSAGGGGERGARFRSFVKNRMGASTTSAPGV